MSNRSGQHGAVLFGLAGSMLVVAGGLAGGYYVVATRSEARAATRPVVENDKAPAASTPSAGGKASAALDAFTKRTVNVKTGSGIAKVTWSDLGIEVDPDELARVSASS